MATVLTVGRNVRNLELLGDVLARAGHDTMKADGLAAFDSALTRAPEFGAALVDVTGFEPAVWVHAARLRDAAVPYVVIYDRDNAALRREAMKHGARGVLTKPLAIRDLLAMVAGMLGE